MTVPLEIKNVFTQKNKNHPDIDKMEENSMQTSDPNKEKFNWGLQWIQYHYLQKNNILHSNKN